MPTKVYFSMSHDRNIGIGGPSDRFPESPLSVQRIANPHISDYAAVVEGSRMNLGALLLVMASGEYALSELIRTAAVRNFEAGTLMEVAEVGNGAPFKTLYLQEGAQMRRRRGSILQLDSWRSVGVRSTILARDDFVGRILTDPTLLEPASTEKKIDIIADVSCMMGDPGADREVNIGETLREYRRRIERGVIDLRTGESPIQLLRKAVREGKEYDLVFPDLAAVADRMAFLEVIQASLNPHGQAIIPITFWTGKPFGGTISERQLDDVVAIGGQEVPFEDYLASTYPTLFEVATFPGDAKALIVKGSWLHQKLPLHTFEAEKRPHHHLGKPGLSIKWTPPQTEQ